MAIDLKSIAGGRRQKPPKVVLYGVPGIGKTTFGSMAPDPIFLFTEDGQGDLDLERFEPRKDDPVLRTWEELMECITFLYTQKHDYKTVVLDGLTNGEQLCWQHLCDQYKQPKIDVNDKGSPFAFGRGYLYSCDLFGSLLQGFDALNRDRGMAIILIGHATTIKLEPPDAESYTQYDIDVHKRLSAKVRGWAEDVLFARWKTHVVTDKEGFGGERKRAVGPGERLMFTEDRPAWHAKNRHSFPVELPFSWDAYIGAMTPAPETKTKKKGS